MLKRPFRRQCGTPLRRGARRPETLESRLLLTSSAAIPAPLAAADAQPTDNQKFVEQAFHDLLGRPADAGGLQYWTDQLASGAPLGQIAQQLTHTDEYFSTIIKPAFLNYLGRPADADGLSFWISQMRGGLTDEHLEAGFIGSSEFYVHAGGTDTGWVDAMYTDLLGRPADSNGEQYWTTQLANGANRADVAYGFAASLEREGQRVQADYEHYLHRSSDQDGLSYWVNQFAQGVTNENLIAGFVGAPEYFKKAAATTLTVSAHLTNDTGASTTDGITNDDAVSGQATDTTTVTSLAIGLDAMTADQFVDVSSSLNTDGSFSLSPGQLAQAAGGSLADGAHTLHVQATDAASNVTTADVTFTLDTQLPTVAFTSPSDGTSSATNVTIAGKVADALSGIAGLQAAVDGGSPASVSVDANGNFSLTTQLATDGSANGPHVIHFVATDVAGNAAAASDFHFTLAAATGPAVNISTAAPTQPINHNVTIVGQAIGTGVTGLSAALDGGSFSSVPLDAAGNFSYATTLALDGSADGPHTVHLQATDTSGKVLKAVDFSFTLDTVPPKLNSFDLSAGSLTGAAGSNSTDAAHVTLVGQTDPGVQVTLVGTGLTALASGSGAFTFTGVSLPQGDTTLTAQASDAAGNTTEKQLIVHRTAPSSQTDPVIAWNQNTLAAIQQDASDPLTASRGMAMVQAAVYDAVNAVEGKPGHFISLTAPADSSPEAAVAQAAHDVLVYLYPAQQTTFDTELASSLGAIAAGQAKTDGISTGKAAAAGIIALRANDGWNNYVSYSPPTDPGSWQATAPSFSPALKPQWATLEPWVMTSDNQFDPAGPPALSSQAWADAVNQVKSLGAANNSTRTADQTQIAHFWSDGNGTATPPGHWNEIADQIAAAQGNSLDDNARLFAELDAGLADAAVVGWNTKFQYNTWRPITVIQDPSASGNSAVTADPTWQPLLVTPNFPEYISGHSTFSGTAAGILDAVFGANTSFKIGSDALPGVTRSFTNFDAAAEEAGISRIYGGIHFLFSDTDGLAAGHALASYVLSSFDTSHDVVPPKITITNPPQDSATAKQVAVTGQVLDNLSGTQSLTVAVDGGAAAPLTFDASGKFTFTTTLALDGTADGEHTIHFQATDFAGNTSAPADFNFTLASQAPTLSVTSPADKSTVDASSVLSGTVKSAATIVSLNYTLDGGHAMPLSFGSDGSFSQPLDVSKLATGDHTLVVTAADAAGNTVHQTLTVHLAALVPLTVKSISPAAGASDVGVTYRPLVTFSRAIDTRTLTSSDFYATDSTGTVVPASIVPANDGTFAWLFFTNPLPGASTITITLDGSKVKDAAGNLLDAAGNGTPGSVLTTTFTTVNTATVPGTSITGIVADPGPDLLPATKDDVAAGPDGVLMTADDVYKLPIAGVTVYILGHQDQAVTTAADGSFTLSPVPTGDVKLVLDGRTSTNAPVGFYFPEMVMDLQIQPGVKNTVMEAMASSDAKAAANTERGVYLPRLQTALLQNVDSSKGAMVTTNADSAPDLTSQQRQALTVDVAPNSVIGPDGKPMSTAQIGISTVPPSLVADMLPPGVMQHTFDITVQAPGVATFSTPAPMTFPNVFNSPPGTKLDFLSFDHTTGRLVIEGTATVSADGLTVTTDPGTGVTHPGWHGLAPPGSQTHSHPSQPCTDSGDGDKILNGLGKTAEGTAGILNGMAGIAQAAEGLKIEVFPPAVNVLLKAFKVGDDLHTLLSSDKPWSDKAASAGDLVTLGLDIFVPEVGIPLEVATTLFKLANGAKDMYQGAEEIKSAQNEIEQMVKLPPCDHSMDGQQQPAADKLIADAGKLSQKASDQIPKFERLKEIAADFYTILKLADPRKPNLGLTSDQITQLGADSAESNDIIDSIDNAGPAWIDGQTVLDDAGDLNNLYSEASGGASGGGENGGQPPGPLYWEANIGGNVVRGTTNNGDLTFFAGPNQFSTVQIYDPNTNEIGVVAKTTSVSGTPTTFGGVVMLADTGADSTGDGLSDTASDILGITPQMLATKLKGVNVAAELQQGLSPLNGAYLPTGVVSSLQLQGEAQQVVLSGNTTNAQQQTAYVATGSYGLAIVDASQFTKPTVLGQIKLPGNSPGLTGDATSVSVDPVLNLAAVADGSGGLAIVDVSNPSQLKVAQNVAGDATNVVAVDGVAYASVGSELRSYDMLTGDRLQVLPLGGGTITGLTREGTLLYAMDSGNKLSVVDIGQLQMTARGSVVLPDGGGQLFVGGGTAYVGATSNVSGGFETVDVSNPDDPKLIAGTSASGAVGAPMPIIAANGSGSALIGTALIRGTAAVQLYDVSDPTNTGKFVTEFPLPAGVSSLTIGSGVAFVADGSDGLQVVNYLPFDTKGIAPKITVDASSIDTDPSTPGIQAVEGSLVTLKATVSDDVQVRNVELSVNGNVVKNNVTFPFDLSTFLPTIASGGTTATLQVEATDTGGNTTTSDPITVSLLHDTTPPTIRSQTPASGGTVSSQFRSAVIDFSKSIDPSTISAADFAISGTSGTIAPENVELRLNNTQVQVTFPAGTLALGDYQFIVHAAKLSDAVGNALGSGDLTTTFHVSKYSAVWSNVNGGSWNDPKNWDSLQVPGPGDDVLIDEPGNVSITYDSGDTSIRSLVSHDPLTITGGSLSATQSIEVDGNLTISGGTLADTLVLPSTGGEPVSFTKGTLDGVNIQRNVNIPGNAYVYVTNGLTIKGTLNVGDGIGGYADIEFEGSQSLTGNGDVDLLLGDLILNIAPGATGTLTLGPGVTLHGFGNAGVGHQNYTATGILVNQGTISADNQGNANNGLNIGLELVNQGQVSLTTATQLHLDDVSGNLGKITLSPGNSSNEYLDLGGSDYVIDKGLTAPPQSQVTLFGTWTNAAGSTITADGATLVIGGQSGVVQNTSIWSNAGVISGINGARLVLGGEYTLGAIGTLTHSADSTVELGGTLDLSPVAPSGLTAAVGNNFVMLRWNDNSTHESGYQVERSTDGVHFSALGTVGANVTSYTDNATTSGATYTYRVRAYNTIGDSHYSNLATAVAGTISHGLLVALYGTSDLSGPIVLARAEANMSGNLSALPVGVTAPLSGRWQGQIVAPTTDTYTFSAQGDAVKVWVNGKLVADNTSNGASTAISLTAGVKYSFLVEDTPPSYQTSLGPYLYWSTSSMTQKVVPADAFYMPTAAIAGLPANVAGSTVTVTGGDTLALNATTGNWELEGEIVGGTIAPPSGGAALSIPYYGVALDGVTLSADLEVPNTATLQTQDDFVLNGNLTVDSGGTANIQENDATQGLAGTGTVTLKGGTLYFYNTDSNAINTSSFVYTIEKGITIQGTGILGSVNGEPRDNQATLIANSPGAILGIGGEGNTNEGTVTLAPGGELGVFGDAPPAGGSNFALLSNSTLNLQIGGTDPSSFGQIVDTLSDGTSSPAVIALGGTLNVSFVNSFAPVLGDSFKFINVTGVTGTFATINVSGLPSGLTLTPVYEAADVKLVVGKALMAAPATVPGNAIGGTLTTADAAAVEQAAINRWAAAGLDPRLVTLLKSIDISVAHLGNDVLALTAGNQILISDNAEGLGWFVDPTPADDTEFAPTSNGNMLTALPGGPASGRIDLLTALMHELGHELGLEHIDDGGLMDDTLPAGERRAPSAAEVYAVFAA